MGAERLVRGRLPRRGRVRKCQCWRLTAFRIAKAIDCSERRRRSFLNAERAANAVLDPDDAWRFGCWNRIVARRFGSKRSSYTNKGCPRLGSKSGDLDENAQAWNDSVLSKK